MESFVKGEVVVVTFPFSDLSRAKRRPALVIQDMKGDDLLLAQITSKRNYDDYSIELLDRHFESGSLKQASYVRPNKLFTCAKSLIVYKVGSISQQKIEEVIEQIRRFIEK